MKLGASALVLGAVGGLLWRYYNDLSNHYVNQTALPELSENIKSICDSEIGKRFLQAVTNAAKQHKDLISHANRIPAEALTTMLANFEKIPGLFSQFLQYSSADMLHYFQAVKREYNYKVSAKKSESSDEESSKSSLRSSGN